MKFLANHNNLEPGQNPESTYFLQTFAPFIVALMQYSGAVFTEIINIIAICSLENTKEVIMNFIALGVISEIDNYYLTALPPSELKSRLRQPFPILYRSSEINFWKRNLSTKIIRCYYKLLRAVEVSFQYYFTPFVVVILTYLLAGIQKN